VGAGVAETTGSPMPRTGISAFGRKATFKPRRYSPERDLRAAGTTFRPVISSGSRELGGPVRVLDGLMAFWAPTLAPRDMEGLCESLGVRKGHMEGLPISRSYREETSHPAPGEM
jgi:hypothetical protein